MYTNATIKTAVDKLKGKIDYYNSFPVDNLLTCISKKNTKIGNVLNISLPPILTCANCSGCMRYCYDIKALLFRTEVIDARARNYSIWTRSPEKYFSDIREKLSRKKTNKFVRWHVSGDIPNYSYLKEMIAIANEFPDFKFWTYTKNYSLVNRYVSLNGKDRKVAIPSNLSIMFSEWKGMKMKNPYDFPVFSVVFKSDTNKPDPAKNHYCPGHCTICIKNHRGCLAGEKTYVNEH